MTSGIPQVTGLKLDEAIATLERAGFNASWGPASAQGTECTVVNQNPAAGTQAARSTSVALLYISAGKDCRKKSD